MSKKRQSLVMGLMSGTSMDAIDAAIVDVGAKSDTLLWHISIPYPASLRQRLLALLANYEAPLSEMALLHRDVGQAFAAVAERCLLEASRRKICRAADLRLIGSHGQTIFHSSDEHVSWQLGESSWISARLGVPVVSDFRVADLALGGEGAPLLPWYHRRIFAGKKGIAIHNLGGISNFTYLGKNAVDIWGCDTGPASCWIDGAILALSKGKKTFDAQGSMAAKGKVAPKLFAHINHDPAIQNFLRQAPPKSTGRELFSEKRLAAILAMAKKNHISDADILATLTEFTASTIAHTYDRWVLRKNLALKEIVFCGGGSKNTHLLGRVRQHLPQIKISRLEDYGYSAAAVEAQAFGVFARMWEKKIPINIPAVTGAKTAVICGKLTPALNNKN